MDNGQERLRRLPRTDEYDTLPEVWEVARRFNLGPGGGCAMETYIFLKEQGIVELPEFIDALDAAIRKGDFYKFGKRSIAWMKQAYEKMLEELPPGEQDAKQREYLMERVGKAMEWDRHAERLHRGGNTYWNKFDSVIGCGPMMQDMPWWYRELEEDCGYNFKRMMEATKSYAGRPGEALKQARIRAEREKAREGVAGVVQS